MLKRTVAVGPLTFRVISNGDDPAPTSPTFVLIHGIGMSHRYLLRLHKTLAATHTTVAIDLPGYGGVPKPKKDVGVAEMARGLTEVIRSLGAGPVVLVGHSMGTQWVTEVARQSPELVERLVLIGPVVDSKRRNALAQGAALARDTFGETPRVNWIVTSDYFRCGPRWYFAQVRHMLSYPLEEEVARVQLPMLIIRGSRDPIAKHEWSERLRDHARDAHLVEIPPHHHVVQESAASDVAQAIHSFVARAEGLSP